MYYMYYIFFVSAELVELDVFLFGLSRNDSTKDKEGFNARNSRYFAVEWGKRATASECECECD